MSRSAQLQREADAARVGLADTLGQLRDGVTPSALSSEVIALVKDSGLSLVKTLAEQARANPVPALLIGAGLTMLLTHTSGRDVMTAAGSALKSAAHTGADAARGAAASVSSSVSSAAADAASSAASAATGAAAAASEVASATARTVKETVADAAGAMKDRVGGTVDQAKETVQSTVDAGRREWHDRRDQAQSLAGSTAEQARTMGEETLQSLSRLLDEQPILMAALAAALGAAVGAALPLTEAEKEIVGPTGAKAVGAGRAALDRAADVIRQEAAAADLGGKARDLADKVVEGVTRST